MRTKLLTNDHSSIISDILRFDFSIHIQSQVNTPNLTTHYQLRQPADTHQHLLFKWIEWRNANQLFSSITNFNIDNLVRKMYLKDQIQEAAKGTHR